MVRKNKQEKHQISYGENPFEQTIIFDRKLRGYSAEQVDDYVAELAKEYNRMYSELTNLKNEYLLLKTRNDFLENNVNAISDTLIRAEIIADEMAKSSRGIVNG